MKTTLFAFLMTFSTVAVAVGNTPATTSANTENIDILTTEVKRIEPTQEQLERLAKLNAEIEAVQPTQANLSPDEVKLLEQVKDKFIKEGEFTIEAEKGLEEAVKYASIHKLPLPYTRIALNTIIPAILEEPIPEKEAIYVAQEGVKVAIEIYQEHQAKKTKIVNP